MSNQTTDPRQQTIPMSPKDPQPQRVAAVVSDGLPPIISELLDAAPPSGGLSKKSQYELLKTQIAPGCTDDELALFLHIARSRGFDPFARHIYARKQRAWDNEKRDYVERMIIITGIDAFRLKAARTKEHTGTSDAEFEYDPKLIGPLNPDGIVKAKMTVHRKGNAFHATCFWHEFRQTYKKDGIEALVPMWAKMSHNQLEKCVEVKSLKRAFPEEFADIYSDDEIGPSITGPVALTPIASAPTVSSPAPQSTPAPSAPSASIAATTPKKDPPAVTPEWIEKGVEAEKLLNGCKTQEELAGMLKTMKEKFPKGKAPNSIREKIGELYAALEKTLPKAAQTQSAAVDPQAPQGA